MTAKTANPHWAEPQKQTHLHEFLSSETHDPKTSI